MTTSSLPPLLTPTRVFEPLRTVVDRLRSSPMPTVVRLRSDLPPADIPDRSELPPDDWARLPESRVEAPPDPPCWLPALFWVAPLFWLEPLLWLAPLPDWMPEPWAKTDEIWGIARATAAAAASVTACSLIASSEASVRPRPSIVRLENCFRRSEFFLMNSRLTWRSHDIILSTTRPETRRQNV